MDRVIERTNGYRDNKDHGKQGTKIQPDPRGRTSSCHTPHPRAERERPHGGV